LYLYLLLLVKSNIFIVKSNCKDWMLKRIKGGRQGIIIHIQKSRFK